MSITRRVIKNTGFLYAKMGITVFITLYTTRLILNSLGAKDFGIFNLVGGAIAMLGFLNAAMTGATQRFMSYSEGQGDKEKQKTIFNISMVLHCLIAIIVGLLLLIAGYFFFNGILNIDSNRVFAAKVVYGSLIISTVFTVMTVPYEAVLNAHENMLYYAIVGILESVLKLAVALIVVFINGDKLIIYGVFMAVIPLITITIMRVYCHKHYVECQIAPNRYWDKSLMKEMTSFAGWNLLGNSSGMIVNYGQGIIINNFFGVIANTSQGIANQINGQLSTLSLTMMKALNPVLAKSEGAGNRNVMIQATIFGSKISIFLMLILFVPIWMEMPYILQLWLKDIPSFSILFCRLLMINTLIGYSIVPVTSSLSAHGNIRQYQIVVSILYYIPLLIMFFLFKNGYDAYYSYIVLGIYTVIASGITLYYAKKNYQFPIIDFLKRVVFKTLLILSVMIIVSYIPVLTLTPSISRLLYVFSLSTSFYLIMVWFIGFNSIEKAQLYNSLKPFSDKYKKVKSIKQNAYL